MNKLKTRKRAFPLPLAGAFISHIAAVTRMPDLGEKGS
jgi:hypothetical protein